MQTIRYSATRLTFKRDLIEPLNNDDVVIIDTPEGTFKMTKADIYNSFANVIQSVSYQENGNYNYRTLPQKALDFLVEPNSANFTEIKSFRNEQKSLPAEITDVVGDEIREKIHEIGKLWRKSAHNKVISKDILIQWDTLIEDWINDKGLPLIVRKDTAKKGQSFHHSTGREIIIADNSVAIWVYYNALQGNVFSVSQIKHLLEEDKIPVMFIASKRYTQNAKYKKALDNLLQGWKVCHINAVGFNDRKGIEEIDIDKIHAHFRKYAKPSNMFLLPKEIGGLGELKEFIEEQAKNQI